MINFPSLTYIHRRIPKEAFYNNMDLTPQIRSSFVSDVDRVLIEYGFTKENLNLSIECELEAIYVVKITLKVFNYDSKILETMARQNPHKLVFLLSYGEQGQIALYEKKLYYGTWLPLDKLNLEAHGQSLKDIWDGFVEQIALREETEGTDNALSVEERLHRQNKIQSLEKLVAKTEAAERKERQPHKKFELHQKIVTMREELEGYRHG